MKVITLAAGLAAGYVLGSRAGRERYEQMVAAARKAGAHPTVVQAQEKVKGLLGTESDAVTVVEETPPVVYTPPTRSSRRKSVTTAKATGTAPLT